MLNLNILRRLLAVYRDMEGPGRITRNSHGEFERQRLHILERIETYLNEYSKLTPTRRQAVNDACHELPRRIWERNRQLATDIYQRILASDRLVLQLPVRRFTGPLFECWDFDPLRL
jgi:hypothetical protein